MQASLTQCLQSARPAQVFRQTQRRSNVQQRHAKQSALVVRAAAYSPPAVSDAKMRFMQSFKRPLPGLYSTIVQELLVQQHLFRWNKGYQYSEVTALGLVSIFDQVLAGLPDAERALIFDAFVLALEEDPAQYRADAAKLEAWAKALPNGAADIKPDAAGDEVQAALARVAAATASSSFLYTKFFAVGLFRLLEVAGAKDPKTLGALVSSLGVPQERVNADLLTYKGVLSKLQAAKEIMKEFLEREKKKNAERLAAKAAKVEASVEA